MPDQNDCISVVICDDHSLVAEALEHLLGQESDIEVVATVGTVARAVETVKALRPKVVLMDYELPDGNGVEATAAIKAAVPDTQVVILTSYTDEAVLVAAIEAGCTGFMTKQQKRAQTVAAIRSAAVGESLVSPDMLIRLLPRIRRGAKGSTELTPREHQVLELLAVGASHTKIEADLFLSRSTVRNHVQNVLMKLGAHSRLEAVAIAVRDGLIHR